MSIACTLCDGECTNCKYDDLCEKKMNITNNVPIIEDSLYVGNTDYREYRKTQLKVVK